MNKRVFKVGDIVRMVDTNFKFEGKFGKIESIDEAPYKQFVVRPIPSIHIMPLTLPFHWEQLVPLSESEAKLFEILNEL